jgi:competence protein ComEC
VRAFAPWAIFLLTLAVISAVVWRSWTLRATAIPFALLGLLGATRGPGFDLAVSPTGEAAALRLPSGKLALMGPKTSAFAAEQWLRADADGRAGAEARGGVSCDEMGCVARAVDGRIVALVTARGAFLEDCARAALIVTPLSAPEGCAAPVVIDRQSLAETGAVAVKFLAGGEVLQTTARSVDEDRPWSPAPQARRRPAAPRDPSSSESDEEASQQEPLDD